ncbi:dipeptide epimerase [Reichenbachiella sp. MALMAid0571]|uniref:mandelate racemase/muconate lactonizing enzyme family protein n=1 Tax=Reichenbachiella sp. MALMAid0571 TaxID=3143939 RepID=UPI0032E0440D
MKIISVNTYLKDLDLIKPFTIAYKTVSKVENVFFEIELENGICGIGSANPSPQVVGETPEQALDTLQSEFVNSFIGKDIRHFNELIDKMAMQYPESPGALAAIDIALHDAFCKYLGIPVVEFYGQKIRKMPTSVTIGIMSVQESLKEAAEYYKQGFRIIKVKTGTDVDEDTERIRLLHEHYANKLQIRVDANQGYDINQLGKFIKNTASCNVELIEQPLPVGQESELSVLDYETRKTLAADESLIHSGMALKLCHEPMPYGIFNIKLMKCGGIKGALEISNIAQKANIDLFWGCNDESIVSISAALHVAFSCSNTRYIDLDGSFDLGEDIVKGGFALDKGFMSPLGLPGLGVKKI